MTITRRSAVRHLSALLLAAAALAAPFASAQEGSWDNAPPSIRDLVLGQPVSAQPIEFQEFACGTNGGPASRPLTGFADFALCPAEETGLHEVQFRHDDELYYIALAARDFTRAEFLQGTRIGNFAILASALFDDAGILRGVRAVTDDRISDRNRRLAYTMSTFIRSTNGADGWECVDIPPEEGETPMGNLLIKQDCRKLSDDGTVITTSSRILRRVGQTLIDPANGELRPGLFESTGRMEIYQVDAAGNPIYGTPGAAPVVEEVAAPAAATPVEAFLAGITNDCPGCDLAGADLKRRNLAGANLSGANLAGATLHRVVLGGANLDGANLVGANLNLADLKRASLAGANLTEALMYQADAAAANFEGALLDGTMVENARFTNARMAGVHWTDATGLGINLAGTDLTGAILTGSQFPQGDLQRATLTGADLTDGSFYAARLRAADLDGTVAVRADFLEADLSDASLAGADLTEARLLRARVSGLDLTGAVLTGAIMPDGSTSP